MRKETNTHSSSAVKTSKQPLASIWSSILSSGTDTLRERTCCEAQVPTEGGRGARMESGTLDPDAANPNSATTVKTLQVVNSGSPF